MRGGALAGRRALVTGGGRGIGAAVARALAVAGARVVVASRTQAEVERVASGLRASGADVSAAVCDVASEESVVALGREAARRLGGIDVLVNNAGVSAGAPLAMITLAEWTRLWIVIATGTFLCTREFVPGMVERKWGRVVNVASIAGLEGARYIAHYSAAKHAVVGLTRSLAVELEGTGVTVNALCPGYADTPMTEANLAKIQARRGLSRDAVLAAVLATTGQERLIAPDEVAAEALALCLDGAAEVTGQAIVLRGSVSAR